MSRREWFFHAGLAIVPVFSLGWYFISVIVLLALFAAVLDAAVASMSRWMHGRPGPADQPHS